MAESERTVLVARELRCGRATVYRVLKQAGRG